MSASASNKIVFVCTGNTCRSPMAERLLQQALAQETSDLSSLQAVSAGVSAFPGDAPSAHTVDALREVGIDGQDHRSQAMTTELAEEALAIICMTQSHLDVILAYLPDQPNLFLMQDFHPDSAYHGSDIPDPIGQSLSAYQSTRDVMAACIPNIIAFIKTQLSTL